MAYEVRHRNEQTGGEKGSKPERFDLIPCEPLAELARHYGIGAMKYEDENWKLGYDWKYSFAAMQRHAWEWWNGQEHGIETFVHRETGEEVKVVINHMIAVAWHAFALHWYSLHRRELAPEQFYRKAPSEPS